VNHDDQPPPCQRAGGYDADGFYDVHKFSTSLPGFARVSS
jgi:hypothetical protein